jgi:two-component system, chemotaxis family, sensor kinase CheA
MPATNDALLKKLLATFRIEAEAHLHAMSSGLLALQKNPADGRAKEIVEAVFRDAHSLKGAARAVNLTQIETVCQPMESVFASLKNGRLAASPPLIDLMLRTVDALAGLLALELPGPMTQTPLLEALVRELNDAVDHPPSELPRSDQAEHSEAPRATGATATTAAAQPGTAKPAPVAHAAFSLASPTVRISAAKLDAVMCQAEELLQPRLAANQRVQELGEAAAELALWKKRRLQIVPALRQVARKFGSGAGAGRNEPEKQAYRDLCEYLNDEHLHIKTLEDRLGGLQRTAKEDHRMLAGMMDSLCQDTKEMQLLPFSSLLDIFPRLCRELARAQGKQVELEIQGGELEIDRHILEEMKDPLIHLVRNCIDHGIERPALRLDRGKPAHGTIRMECAPRDSGTAEVLVADDGAGFDAATLKAAAHRLGMVSREEAEQIDETGAVALAFQSGVSASDTVTDISGRGLGLAIVREKVERQGGSITVKSTTGAGTAFHIILPRTLANFRAVLVRAGGQVLAIPLKNVERVCKVRSNEIRTVENREMILLDDQPVSLVRLSEILEMPRNQRGPDPASGAPALVIGAEPAPIAFLVDEIAGEQEILVKALARPLVRVRNIAGASVLGDGHVMPVLNVADLLKSAAALSQAHPGGMPQSGKADQASEHSSQDSPPHSIPHSILVVEDSITSRTLLKNILESAGYLVNTAVDGVEGYAALKAGAFSLVVSDVEMPRMDGFALTARIRADGQLTRLPVILVTALESRDHRERGIDAGANAYIVKSGFDQGSLLAAITRLIGPSPSSGCP